MPSWSEIVHDIIHHPFGREDPAYEAHLFREEVTRILRHQLSLQQAAQKSGAQVEQALVQVEQALVEQNRALRELFEDLFEDLAKRLDAMRDAIQSGFEMSKWATVEAIARSAWLTQQALAESRDAMVRGFRDLQAAFSFGLSQIVWYQEQTNKLLTDVLSVLKAPRKTEADEMRARGDEAYRNGINARRSEDRQQWMNVALQAYAECVEKNPSDFSALYSMATILFYERGISEHALSAFRMAATFAEPYSPYHAALAWLQLSYIRRCRKEWEQAYEATEEAVRLQPDWAETYFQHAISCALTQRLEEMKEQLKQAIRLDRNYWLRATTEPDLLKVHKEVGKMLEELRQEASQKAVEEISSAESSLAELTHLIQEVAVLGLPTSSALRYAGQAERALDDARSLKAQETYFELLDAQAKAKEVQQICEQGTHALSEEAHNALDSRQQELEAELSTRTQEHQNAQEELESRAQQELRNVENTLQSDFHCQFYQISSERDKIVSEAERKWSKWDKRARKAWSVDGAGRPAKSLGCLIGLCGCIAHVGQYTGYTTDGNPLPTLVLSLVLWALGWLGTYVVVCGLWWLICLGLAGSAKQAQRRLSQEYDHRIAKLEQEYLEELEQRKREINERAEQESQALREQFERQRAELQRQIEEVIQKREALARLLPRLRS